ncbi:MAG: hypothetical protein CL663_07995 [Bacteroidetes bacterium]|nr:hypothetical protein [Bacteroidota bacterium]
MNPWPKYNFLRFVIIAIPAVISSEFFSVPKPILILSILLIIIGILSWKPNILKYKFRSIYGFVICVFIFISFNEYASSKLNKTIPDQLFSHENQILLEVADEPIRKKNSYRFNAIIQNVRNDSLKLDKGFKVQIYMQSKDSASLPLIGTSFIASVRLMRIEKPLNPHQFNYKRYLRFNGVLASAFIDVNEIIIVSKRSSLKSEASRLRTYLMLKLKDKGLSDGSHGIASAMLLGDDSLLDREDRKKYSAAGAMHILCVSGLHLGVIYLFFDTILSLFFRSSLRKLKFVLLIVLIWFYAFIAGLSPSVLRASTMISFVILGNIFNRKGNVFNSLAASAFFLMLLDPLIIYKLGFQLSYSAVIAIVCLFKPINSLFVVKNYFLEKIWSVISVTICAQLGTFSLAVFYFNQFPLYFLISNIAVLFLASLIINLGFIVLILIEIPKLSDLLILIEDVLIKILNAIIGFVDSLPHSLIEGIIISKIDVLFIYLLITGAFIAILQRSKSFVWITLISSLLLVFSLGFDRYKESSSTKIWNYSVRGNSPYMDFMKNGNCVSVYDLDKTDSSFINFSIRPNQIHSFIKDQKRIDIGKDTLLEEVLFKKKGDWIVYRSSIVLTNPERDHPLFNELIEISPLKKAELIEIP